MVLVTGGTGFLGAILVNQLLDLNVAVRATRRMDSRIPKSLEDRPGLEWVYADVLDYFALSEAFDQVTQVYHCAAQVSYHPAYRRSMMKTNVEGTAHVVNLCLLHGARLLHVSSIAALGAGKDGAETTEADLWTFDVDQSAYSIAKYESEMEVWRGFSEGLDGVIVNPSLIIGASAGRRGSGAVFHLLNKGLRFYPGGSVGLVDAEDVAKAMIRLMNKPEITEERFIVSNVNMSHQDMLTQCSTFLAKPAPKVKASPFLLEIAWRLSMVVAWMRGKKSALTRDSARVSSIKMRFSNRKLLDAVGMEFKPIEMTFREICTDVVKNTLP